MSQDELKRAEAAFQEFEFEADEFSVYLSAAFGFNPAIASKVLHWYDTLKTGVFKGYQRISPSEKNKDAIFKLERELGIVVHPPVVERIKKVDAALAFSALISRQIRGNLQLNVSSPVSLKGQSYRKTLHKISRDGRRIRNFQWGLTSEFQFRSFVYISMFFLGIMVLTSALAFFSGVPLLLVFMSSFQLTAIFLDTVIIQPVKLLIQFINSPLHWVYFSIFMAAVSVSLIRYVHGIKSLTSGLAGWLADFILLLWPRRILHAYLMRMRMAALIAVISGCSFIFITAGADTIKNSFVWYLGKYTGMTVSSGDAHMISFKASDTLRKTERTGQELVNHDLNIDWEWGNGISLVGDIVVRGKSSRRSLQDGFRRPYDTGLESQEYVFMPERIGSRYPFAYGAVGKNNGRFNAVSNYGEIERFTIDYIDPVTGKRTQSGAINKFDRQEIERKNSYEIKDVLDGGSSSPVVLKAALRRSEGSAPSYNWPDADKKYLLGVTRQAWEFFAENVTEKTSYLPPDFVQVGENGAVEKVVYQTSTTNIGTYILCVVAAIKMGFIGLKEGYDRINNTIKTVEKILLTPGQSYKGHLYNWYSIDGQPRQIWERHISTIDNGNFAGFLIAAARGLAEAERLAIAGGKQLLAGSANLRERITKIFDDMDFGILYDDEAGLLHRDADIENKDGEEVFTVRAGHYNLIMSEARLAYMVAIMKGDIPAESWLNLGGKIKNIGVINDALLLQSWSGTGMELLMPRLLAKENQDTLLGQAEMQAVRIMMRNALAGGTLWGKSETAAVPTARYAGSEDVYAAIGDEELAIDREFTGMPVTTWYASAMAASLVPHEVADNLRALESRKMRGKYGFYESVLIGKKKWLWFNGYSYKPMRRFYAHHGGWGFLGLVNALNPGTDGSGVLTDWFHGSQQNNKILESLIATKDYKVVEIEPGKAYEKDPKMSPDPKDFIGHFGSLVYASDTGWSGWGRWNYALSCNKVFYIKDITSGKIFSVGLELPESVERKDGKITFNYRIGSGSEEAIRVQLELSYSPEDTLEIWNLIITNDSALDRVFEVTGYHDWIMDDVNAYLGHPVYRDLFIKTDFDRKSGVITAQRRTVQGPEQERQPVGFFARGGKDGASVDGWDTSRLSFLGWWLGGLGSLAEPVAILRHAFKGNSGYTLNPAAALSKTETAVSGKSITMKFLSGSAESREDVEKLVARHRCEETFLSCEHMKQSPSLPSDDTFLAMRELKIKADRAMRIRGVPAIVPEVSPELLYEFSSDGSECIIKNPLATKKPWSMVVSNGVIGFVANAAGSAYSFYKNSQQSRITPYYQVPRGVMVKNTVTGEEWSLIPNPRSSANGKYEVRVSPGYIRYIFTGAKSLTGLTITMTMFVDKIYPIEFWQIDAAYAGKAPLSLEVSSFLKWALGQNYPKTADQTRSWLDKKSGALFAQSKDSIFPGSVAFHAFVGGQTVTGTLMSTEEDPFDGLNAKIEFVESKEGGNLQKKSVSFLLGQAESEKEAQEILARYHDPVDVQKSFEESVADVRKKLGAAKVTTPDRSFNILVNNWLPYQAYYAHILARSGMYQSGGAFGFRDQLQSFMNLLATGNSFFRDETRKHIIESTRHQFSAGDVQHWWHAHNNFGQRSRISDNLLWLPYALAYYLETTGDTTILDEKTPYIDLDSREWDKGELKLGENDRCFVPQRYTAPASVYEHAKKAIDRVLGKIGEHGIPLMGSGDWNDALNRVGPAGKGESIWLGFFLYDNLNRFALIADGRHDSETAERYRAQAAKLKDNLEKFGWNRGYFIRAYTDSREKLDFVDAIVQSWAVISGGASESHAKKAIRTAVKRLYRAKHQIILLFDRAIDKFIDYPPGIRENMAQYTHGVSWLPLAAALLGDGDLAFRLYQALLPTTHATDPVYGGEPYAVAADIYGADREGEAGWTWYSGGPGWIYRIGMEYILGIRFRAGSRLMVSPCIPKLWKTYSVTHRRGDTRYTIVVNNPSGVSTGVKSIAVDGKKIEDIDGGVVLQDDGKEHRIVVVMGKPVASQQITLGDAGIDYSDKSSSSPVKETIQSQIYGGTGLEGKAVVLGHNHAGKVMVELPVVMAKSLNAAMKLSAANSFNRWISFDGKPEPEHIADIIAYRDFLEWQAEDLGQLYLALSFNNGKLEIEGWVDLNVGFSSLSQDANYAVMEISPWNRLLELEARRFVGLGHELRVFGINKLLKDDPELKNESTLTKIRTLGHRDMRWDVFDDGVTAWSVEEYLFEQQTKKDEFIARYGFSSSSPATSLVIDQMALVSEFKERVPNGLGLAQRLGLFQEVFGKKLLESSKFSGCVSPEIDLAYLQAFRKTVPEKTTTALSQAFDGAQSILRNRGKDDLARLRGFERLVKPLSAFEKLLFYFGAGAVTGVEPDAISPAQVGHGIEWRRHFNSQWYDWHCFYYRDRCVFHVAVSKQSDAHIKLAIGVGRQYEDWNKELGGLSKEGKKLLGKGYSLYCFAKQLQILFITREAFSEVSILLGSVVYYFPERAVPFYLNKVGGFSWPELTRDLAQEEADYERQAGVEVFTSSPVRVEIKDWVLKDIISILERTECKDKFLFFGGLVRDMVSGRQIANKDIDFIIPMEINDLARRFISRSKAPAPHIRFKQQDELFGLAACLGLDFYQLSDGVSNFEGRRIHPVFQNGVVFDSLTWKPIPIQTELSINLMAMDLKGNVYDAFGGIEDLKQKKARFVKGQLISPDNIKRALRYKEMFSLELTPETKFFIDYCRALRSNRTVPLSELYKVSSPVGSVKFESTRGFASNLAHRFRRAIESMGGFHLEFNSELDAKIMALKKARDDIAELEIRIKKENEELVKQVIDDIHSRLSILPTVPAVIPTLEVMPVDREIVFEKEIAQLTGDIEKLLPRFSLEGNRKIQVDGREYSLKSNFTRTMYRLGRMIFIVLLSDSYGSSQESVSQKTRALARQYKDKLGDLYTKHSDSIFFISPWSAQPGKPLNDFTVSTIAPILAREKMFKNATVVDFGAGTSVLSSVALSLGARRVILIENNSRDVSFAKVVLEEHGWVEGDDFYILNANLDQKELIRSFLRKFHGMGNLIGLLNMGPWRHYGTANKDSLEIINEDGAFDLVINTGYLSMSIEAPHQEEFQRVKKLFEAQGYQVNNFVFAPKGYLGAMGLIAEKVKPQPVVAAASSPVKFQSERRAFAKAVYLRDNRILTAGQQENNWSQIWQAISLPQSEFMGRLLNKNLFKNGDRVLSLGCGRREDEIILARDIGCFVTATDISPVCISRISQEAARQGIPHRLVARIQDLSEPFNFPDEEFNTVFANCSFISFDDKKMTRIVDETWRVLKRGGKIFAMVYSKADDKYGKGLPLHKDLFNINGMPYRFFDFESLENTFRGFAGIKIRNARVKSLNGETRRMLELQAGKPLFGMGASSPVSSPLIEYNLIMQALEGVYLLENLRNEKGVILAELIENNEDMGKTADKLGVIDIRLSVLAHLLHNFKHVKTKMLVLIFQTAEEYNVHVCDTGKGFSIPIEKAFEEQLSGGDSLGVGLYYVKKDFVGYYGGKVTVHTRNITQTLEKAEGGEILFSQPIKNDNNFRGTWIEATMRRNNRVSSPVEHYISISSDTLEEIRRHAENTIDSATEMRGLIFSGNGKTKLFVLPEKQLQIEIKSDHERYLKLKEMFS
ncbi:MAG: methyltransferase domain-containing protein, partial [Smithella sp.]